MGRSIADKPPWLLLLLIRSRGPGGCCQKHGAGPEGASGQTGPRTARAMVPNTKKLFRILALALRLRPVDVLA